MKNKWKHFSDKTFKVYLTIIFLPYIFLIIRTPSCILIGKNSTCKDSLFSNYLIYCLVMLFIMFIHILVINILKKGK